MKKLFLLIPALCICLLLAGCTSSNPKAAADDADIKTQTLTQDLDPNIDLPKQTGNVIYFEGKNITTDDSRVSIRNNTVTINNGGTYIFAGIGIDSQIYVDAPGEDITILLDNVELSNNYTSPFVVMDADDVVVQLLPGSINAFSDTKNYSLQDDEKVDAPVFSFVSLDMIGAQGASLTIDAYHNDALKSQKSLTLENIDITIKSVDDGIVAKNNLSIINSKIALSTLGDAIKTTDKDDPEHGILTIQNSDIDVKSSSDAVSSTNSISIDGGKYSFTTNKDHNDVASRKGLKAINLINILSGDITLDTIDDALNSNGDIHIQGGVTKITSDDDGIHAEKDIIIDDGKIAIMDSYEAIEGLTVTINGGEIEMHSQDDGFNIAGESLGNAGGRGRVLEGGALTINGGIIYMYAEGDGLDSNGNMLMNGGKVVVFGPTLNNNGAIDVDGIFTYAGGELLALGSAGMAVAPKANTSSIPSVLMYLEDAQSGPTTISIKDSAGKSLITQETEKVFQSIVYGSPSLDLDNGYSFWMDDVEIYSFTITDMVTVLGTNTLGSRRR